MYVIDSFFNFLLTVEYTVRICRRGERIGGLIFEVHIVLLLMIQALHSDFFLFNKMGKSLIQAFHSDSFC